MADDFEENYPIKESYRRFHQGNTAFVRAIKAGKGYYDNKAKKLKG